MLDVDKSTEIVEELIHFSVNGESYEIRVLANWTLRRFFTISWVF